MYLTLKCILIIDTILISIEIFLSIMMKWIQIKNLCMFPSQFEDINIQLLMDDRAGTSELYVSDEKISNKTFSPIGFFFPIRNFLLSFFAGWKTYRSDGLSNLVSKNWLKTSSN